MVEEPYDGGERYRVCDVFPDLDELGDVGAALQDTIETDGYRRLMPLHESESVSQAMLEWMSLPEEERLERMRAALEEDGSLDLGYGE